MATLSQLLAAGVKWITAADKAHAIVNGPSSGTGSTVTVESGVIPTFAKAIADFTAGEVFNSATILTGFDYPFYSVPNDSKGVLLAIHQNGTITLPVGTLGKKVKFIAYIFSTGIPTFAGHDSETIVFKDGFSALNSTAGKSYMIEANYVTLSGVSFWLLEVSDTFTPPTIDP